MATWHQQQAQRRARLAGKPLVFWHETKWTVLTDPPNDMTTLMRGDEAQTREHLASLKARGDTHSILIAPRVPAGTKEAS